MITHLHKQIVIDAYRGSNTYTIKEPLLFADLSYERLYASACCINGLCAINLLKFSDN